MLAIAQTPAGSHADFGLLLLILGVAAVAMFSRGMIKHGLGLVVLMVGITIATGLSFLMTGLRQVFH